MDLRPSLLAVDVSTLGNRLQGLLPGTVSGTTPVLLAALGGSLTYYAGIFNIALEAMMLCGALGAVLGADASHSWLLGIAGGVAAAMVPALLYLLFVIVARTDEFVTGIALNLASAGATTFLLRRVFHVSGSYNPGDLAQVPRLRVPGLRAIPVVGSLFRGDLNWLDVTAVLAAVALAWMIRRSRRGLRLRAAGYNAASLAASGVSVPLVRAWSVVWCGALCGLAGAWLSIGYGRGFGENMTNGRGWIALVAVILARGRPAVIAVTALVFGLADAAGLFSQGYGVPSQLSAMLPYLATLVALFVAARRMRSGRPPAPRNTGGPSTSAVRR